MDITIILLCCGAALAGVAIAAVFSLIPGLHIYNVIAFTMMIAFAAIDVFKTLDPLITTCFIMGLVVGFSVMFTVSSQFFQPCDDSYRSMMLPHERFLFEGRGFEAAMLSGIGSMFALLLIAGLFPFVTGAIGTIRQLIRPHIYWILGLVSLFILVSEWPKDHGVGKTTGQRLADALGPIGHGALHLRDRRHPGPVRVQQHHHPGGQRVPVADAGVHRPLRHSEPDHDRAGARQDPEAVFRHERGLRRRTMWPAGR